MDFDQILLVMGVESDPRTKQSEFGGDPVPDPGFESPELDPRIVGLSF